MLPRALAAAAVACGLAAASPESMAAVGLEVSWEQAEGSEVSLLQSHSSIRTGRHEVGSGSAPGDPDEYLGGLDWPQPGSPDAKLTPEQAQALLLLKSFPNNVKIVNSTIVALALTPTWYVIQEGGYDILFRALHDFDDPTVQMQTLRGLSDQSWTELGSQHITNHGGPNRGVEYLVELLRAHPVAKTAYCADQLTYQYEALQCLAGLLFNDANGTAGAAAVQAGLIEGAVHALEAEADLRPTQHTACAALQYLLVNAGAAAGGYVKRLRELGAPELLQKAVATYSVDDPTPFIFGVTYGELYPVAPQCEFVLSTIDGTP